MQKPAPKEELIVGQLVGNYRLTRKLGEGGMGAVYEAVHEQLHRRVAIKVLHRKFSQEPEFARRFFNEARAVNIVQHAGVVGAFEFGQLPDGAAYIVMEYLEGETLQARIKRLGGRLGLDGLSLARQVASALAAAHAKGIIHRDLKPANVIIVPDPEAPGGERAKILDFGVAKVREPENLAEPAADEPRTKSGVYMGTPMYMAPEQARGAGLVDDKADVYSLGCMLYQFFAGRPPFQAPGEGEVMAMHIFAKVRPVQELAPDTPGPMAHLIDHMLHKQPEERPTMTEVAQELARFGMATGTLPRVSGGYGVGASSGVLVLPPGLGAAPRATDPSLAVPDPPSTMRTASGQRQRARRAQPGAGRLFLLAVPVVAVLAVLAAKGLRRHEAPVPVAPAPAAQLPAPKQVPKRVTVHWSVNSEPAGAQVLRVSDGQLLGTTPWQREQPAGSGEMALVLRHEGCADKTLALDLGRDAVRTEQLTPVPTAVVTAPAPASKKPPKRPAGPAKKPAKKPGREVLDDDIPIIK